MGWCTRTSRTSWTRRTTRTTRTTRRSRTSWTTRTTRTTRTCWTSWTKRPTRTIGSPSPTTTTTTTTTMPSCLCHPVCPSMPSCMLPTEETLVNAQLTYSNVSDDSKTCCHLPSSGFSSETVENNFEIVFLYSLLYLLPTLKYM